jgi:hypothetical protein
MSVVRTFRVKTAVSLVAAACVAAIVAPPFERADAITLVQDPDRNVSTVTGWTYWYGQTPSSLATHVGSSYRIIDIEVTGVDSGGVPTMTAVLVRNSGTYARTGWGWSTGLTSAQVASTIGTTKRLIELERYDTVNGARYAIIYVPNTGVQEKTWGYFTAKTTTQVTDLLSANNARLIDLGTYLVRTTVMVHGIWIQNTGPDLRSTNVYYGVSTSTLTTNVSNTHQRVLTLERRADGTLDAVTVSGNLGWWWNYARTPSQITTMQSQLGTRIYRLEPVNGTGTYDVLMTENLDAESLRIRELARSKMGPYSWGFYVNRIGGSSVVGLQQSTVFEPASAIKVMHELAELRRVAGGSDSLSTRADWYKNPDRTAENEGDGPNTCPDYSESTTTAVRTSIRQMIYGTMWDSDNRLTRGLTLHLGGLATLNSLATTLGMTNTHLDQDRIGCGWLDDKKNATTLADLSRLYELATDGTALDPSQLPNFIDLMINDHSWSTLDPIVDSEAAKLNLTAAKIAAFKAGVLYYGKGGSYGTCPTPQATAPCGPPVIDILTETAVVSLPLPNGATRDYTFGRFMQGTINCTYAACTTRTNATAGYNAIRTEMLRTVVRSALTAWV